jgi:hypothetical protein
MLAVAVGTGEGVGDEDCARRSCPPIKMAAIQWQCRNREVAFTCDFCPREANAQRSTHNFQRSIQTVLLHSLSVGRWTVERFDSASVPLQESMDLFRQFGSNTFGAGDLFDARLSQPVNRSESAQQ